MPQRGLRVRKMSTTEPRRQHALPEKVHIRCLRNGILRVGGQLGFDTRTVVRFSEIISGRRWRRCARADLERHLEHCDDCRVVVDTTKKTIQIFCNSEPVPLPADVRDRLHAALEKRLRQRPA